MPSIKHRLFITVLLTLFVLTAQVKAVEPPQFAPGQLIVKYKQRKKETLKQRFSSLIQSEKPLSNFRTKGQTNLLDQYSIIRVPVGKEEEIMNKIKTDPDVENVELDYLRFTSVIPNDPYYAQQWQYQAKYVDMQNVWDMQGDDNAVMAVIDTGVNINHEDLHEKFWVNTGEVPGDGIDNDENGYVDDINGVNVYSSNNMILDDYGHGTNVASAALANSNNAKGITGISWKGKIMVIKTNISGQGIFNSSDIATALNYAGSFSEVKVINMSFGGGGANDLETKAINDLVDNNKVVLVAAAGNEARNLKDYPSYPASYKGVVAVASHDKTTFSYFSNYGYKIDVVAPGSEIYTANKGGGYSITAGTSLASPLVAGELLFYRLLHPDYTAQETIQALRNWTNCPLNNPNCQRTDWNFQYGYGRLSGEPTIKNSCDGTNLIKSTVLITEPIDRKTYSSQQVLSIKGTVNSNMFRSYSISWGKGDNPTSWSTDGISLNNQGKQQITNGILATWDLSKLTTSDFYLIRVVVNGDATCLNNVVGEDKTGIFVQRVFSISGKITNLSKQPVPGVYVQFYQNNNAFGWVQTNTSGQYIKGYLTTGEYSWVPSLGGETYVPVSLNITLIEGQPDLINQDFVQQLWSPSLTPTPTPIPTATPKPTPIPKKPPCGSYGDVDDDKFITNIDSQWVFEFDVGDRDFTKEQIKRADVNADSKVDVIDGMIIGQYLNNIIPTFPVCSIVPTPTAIPPTPTSIPTPKPTLTPVPTVKPTLVPTKTPTPTPTPIQYPPVVNTNSLPKARFRIPYITTVIASDRNRDKMQMTISGLPKQLQSGPCLNLPGLTSCLIYGIPIERGTLFSIKIKVIDATIRVVEKNLPLSVL